MQGALNIARRAEAFRKRAESAERPSKKQVAAGIVIVAGGALAIAKVASMYSEGAPPAAAPRTTGDPSAPASTLAHGGAPVTLTKTPAGTPVTLDPSAPASTLGHGGAPVTPTTPPAVTQVTLDTTLATPHVQRPALAPGDTPAPAKFAGSRFGHIDTKVLLTLAVSGGDEDQKAIYEYCSRGRIHDIIDIALTVRTWMSMIVSDPLIKAAMGVLTHAQNATGATEYQKAFIDKAIRTKQRKAAVETTELRDLLAEWYTNPTQRDDIADVYKRQPLWFASLRRLLARTRRHQGTWCPCHRRR